MDLVLFRFALSLCIAIYWSQNIKIHQLKNQVAKALADRTQMANYLTNLSHHLRTPINGDVGLPTVL